MPEYPITIYEHETRAFRDLMREVNAADLATLRRVVSFIVDDLWGVGDGTPEDPRTIDPEKEWTGETACEIKESLNTATEGPDSQSEDAHECAFSTPDPSVTVAEPDDYRCLNCGIMLTPAVETWA